ncbi:DUF1989 domain-containing protein [Thiomicrorhabdus sp.]|uniref:DUF1989 domain-containing protein n=1 Tax=Thiomicrorhabdus sp. TaxID=2039724 RepID=UPI0029C749AD|nr:DUF1989 domain-containing protein [Thiomicrorhabdus sp.]
MVQQNSVYYRHEYRIAGQEAIRMRLRSGEKFIVTSEDGCQGCELLPLSGAQDGWSISVAAEKGFAEVTRALMDEGGAAAEKLRRKLQGWQCDSSVLQSAYRFGADALPEVTAQEAISVVVVAAGRKMAVDGHQPAGELNVVHFAREPIDLPEPLAEPVQEIRIPHSSARTYEVKAGQWIQIIDVQGKQSSDFIAFDQEALRQGRELMIDGTATRTVMGRSLPQPGLFSRFLDQEQQTLLEVVQDTVGRHDSFLFACSPKYYEDQGYFGHISCTENFNNALKAYGIQPRLGWPAINFFFNTYAEDCGSIGFAEPWSRAGDYVLLRADRDLLCASSACPDDIDPANGWKPTDIHVRVYGEQENFPRSIAYRTIPEELSRMTKQSGFHRRTSKLTRHFAEYRGYWVATEYDGWGANSEYLACRERVAMIDLTPLRKFEVVGPDAEVFMQYAVTRNVRRMSVGEIVYSAICNETGGMIDDGTLFKNERSGFSLDLRRSLYR